MKPLQGKVALVTGGLGTLGRAQVRKLTAEGATVIVLDRPGLQVDLTENLGENARFLGCDLNDLAKTEDLIRLEAEASGGIDILINNAALIINKPFQEFSLAEYEDQIRVNSSAAFAAVRACADLMKRKGRGKILNFASITLNGQWDGYVPYVASKGAMIGLTKSLARELGPFGINVNAISPGAVVSEAENRVFANRLQEYNDWVLERQCLKTRVKPEDVAELVYFLVSPASDMITGQNFAIDGGW
ncbi:SDR family oxidoreductase [Ensifer adhaerens]|uniref:SDR family oxidoreductase n=1 Tax=Ensifer TaxID=106591 RepID=UPI000715E843|nr:MULTISPECIES: SDR family oxidoreductase [unclassified Ensifer]OWZ90513.1 3-ketoacyl-ACP reductase [Sinorhizobium sp. LM21]KQX52502.1 3-ketoacyl-ACP reductase [Ensifer sp. Root1298]KQX85654.1 3-ketoacyl-ACP reductase [Ensifer sp. Root1312]KRC21540.1 3-ketoacyl-ACP reductase [Ensifer sp. Root74]KRD60793.1 3-ketoacyl-ACP reductase [Ensifer sp. Root954]